MSNPSLILPQSPAYGEDYVYAAQVEDGAVPLYNVLPLTFTRASGGTRINKDGLVQNMPYNLLQYSQEIGNGIAWQSLNSIVITPNSTTAPDGTMTADTLLDVGGASIVRQFDYSVVAGQTYTFSVYLKKATGSPLTRIRIEQDQSPYNNTYIDVTPTNEWVRYSVTRTIEAGITSVNYGIFPDINNGDSVYAWGAQVNIGSTAQPYLATTDRLNMPRITYPVGGGCGALLLEKQSTNYLIYNTQIDNAAWVKARSTVTANATTSPDGTQNGDAVFVNSDLNTNHEVFQYGTGATEGWSAFFKANGYNFVYMFGSADPVIWFDLQNGVVGTQQSGVTGKITNYGNGWYRCEYYKNSGTNSIWGFGVVPSNGVTTIASPDTSKGVYFWGAQAENGLYATSMIPTTSTSATRIADACYKTGISNLIGQTEGTMFVDTYVGNETDEVYGWLQASLSGNPNDSIQINRSGSSIQAQIYNGSTPTALITGGTISKGQRIKVAFAYKANDCVLYLNGTQIGVDTSTAIPACTLFQLGAYPPLLNDYTNDGGINNFQLFTTRLTNAELQALTS